MSCPEDHQLWEFAFGQLEDEAIEGIDAHVDTCDACRALVAEAMHGRAAEPSEQIGRYTIIEPIGQGGMGVVYAARDPDLDRTVAIKILRAELDDHVGRARLLSEARAMAKLSHPNVIGIFEVGTHDDRVFIAMEHVAGGTLASWLYDEERAWPDVLDAFIHAGRGLESAHAQGIVHRDFKPENVLVDVGGRMRVTDFGLARSTGLADDAVDSADDVGDLDVDGLTVTGTIVGTPAYMAPEQYLGRPSDARTDQYSFCVALYEALYGARPFAGDSVEDLKRSVVAGKIERPPEDRKIPARVYGAIAKGLAVEPSDRFVSMSALLDALEPPSRTRSPAYAIAVALVFASVVGFWAWRDYRNGLCDQAGAPVGQVWSNGRQAKLGTVFAEHEDAFHRMRKIVTSYSEQWVMARNEACKDTRIRGTQSEALMDLRMQCLDRRLEELDALLDLFEKADAKLIAKFVGAAHGLSPLVRCSDTTALARRAEPLSPDVERKVVAMQPKVAKLSALHLAARYKEVQSLAIALDKEAKAIGHRRTAAIALWRLGTAFKNLGDLKKAELHLTDATVTAHATGDDLTAASAAIDLMGTVSFSKGPDAAKVWESHAAASIERLGGDRLLTAKLDVRRGEMLQNSSKPKEAFAAYERACTVREQIHGKHDVSLFPCLVGMSFLLNQQARFTEAEKTSERLVTLLRAAYGDQHSSVAWPLATLGVTKGKLGRLDEAEQLFVQAQSIWKATLGNSHPLVGFALSNLGWISLEKREHKKALRLYDEALALVTKVLGPDHAIVTEPLTGKADVLAATKRCPQALEHYRRAAQILEKSPTEVELIVRVHLGLGRCLMTTDDREGARIALERASKLSEGLDPLLSGRVHVALSNVRTGSVSQALLRKAKEQFERAGERASDDLEALRK